jgi:hypothetical protein
MRPGAVGIALSVAFCIAFVARADPSRGQGDEPVAGQAPPPVIAPLEATWNRLRPLVPDPRQAACVVVDPAHDRMVAFGDPLRLGRPRFCSPRHAGSTPASAWCGYRRSKSAVRRALVVP